MPRIERQYRIIPYIALAILASLIVYGVVITLINLPLFSYIVQGGLSVNTQAEIISRLFLAPQAHASLSSVVMFGATIVLFGVNTALVAYQVRRHGAFGDKKGVWGTLLAGLSGILGFGCAACGTLILPGLLSALGIVSFVAILPFRGLEFGMFGLLLMLLACVFLVKDAMRPIVFSVVLPKR